MKAWFQVALLAVGLCASAALAGPDSFDVGSGRDGPLTVTAAGTVINRHARVTGPIAPGDHVLLVAGTEGFGAGDLVMVLQVTGLVPEPSPGSPGPVELTRDAVGRWELARLAAVGEGALTVSSPLTHSYAAQVTQVIRVPEYTHVRIQPGASIRAVPWNGGTGGVVAFLATGTVHNEGEITATGAGFRGGRYVPDGSDPVVCSSMDLGARPGAQKGEGVAVTQYGPTKTGREMVSNGGGGGVCPRAGGGGGGNGGSGAPGGGGADARGTGGQGGSKLVYSLRDHLSFGGGGGSGHGEDWSGPGGGAGGGALFIRASRLTGAGFIVADGEAGGSSSLGGAGGGGAGGSIYLRLSGDASCGGVSTRGGVGGDAIGVLSQAGAGGGGGGGGGRALFRAGSTSGCPVSVAAASNGSRAFSPTGRLLLPEDGVIEAPEASLALEPNKAFITSPVDGATVKDTGGPPIRVCATNSAGECTGGPYEYELFINSVALPKVTTGSPWIHEPSPPLPDGAYTVYARVKPGAGGGATVQSSTVRFTVDTKEPDTFLEGSRPPAETDENSASFSFSSESGAKFECELNAPGFSQDEPFAPCSSPKRYSGLGAGDHIFSVRAIDAAGNVDSSPATHSWRVVVPDTVLHSWPDSMTNSRNAEFTFSAKGALRYVCSLKRPGGVEDDPITNCKSPKQYTDLVDGTYVFSVHGVFALGFEDPTPATYTWTVDTVPPEAPVINLAPPPKSQSRNADFKFFAEGARSYECALNAPGGTPVFGVCNSTQGYENLADGTYVFSVRAVDDAKNKSPVTRHEWMVDASPPEVKFLNPANGDFVSTKTPRINGQMDDPFSRVTIYIDGVAVADVDADGGGFWSLPATAELSEGPHGVYVKAINQVGIEGNPSPINTFTVDTIAPETTIIDAPPKSSSSRLAAFEFRSSESGAEFECQLDGAPFASCPETYLKGQLEDGRHTLLVRARDKARNVDPTPEFHEWFVIINPPPFPDVEQPVDGASMERDTFTITGWAVPNSTVTIYIDDKKSGVAQADESGRWTFRPPTPLEAGEHGLTAETTDEAGNTSAQRSDERVFTIVISIGQARAIGGGLSCASSGTHPASAWALLGSGLWLIWCRRRMARWRR